jgi:hypothetical protein
MSEDEIKEGAGRGPDTIPLGDVGRITALTYPISVAHIVI